MSQSQSQSQQCVSMSEGGFFAYRMAASAGIMFATATAFEAAKAGHLWAQVWLAVGAAIYVGESFFALRVAKRGIRIVVPVSVPLPATKED